MKIFLMVMGLFLLPLLAKGQEWEIIPGHGRQTKIVSSHAPFPHPARKAGHTYSGQQFTFSEHYSDSSIFIFVPEGFRKGKTTDLVVYFHGWWNTIEKSVATFHLTKQVAGSGKNVIFIFPEGARNAADSFGGKMEEQGEFRKMIDDVLHFLKKEKVVETTEPGNIVLAGHSGAYRALAFILNRGQLTTHIKEVYLFDALYDQLEKFAYWVDHFNGRLVSITTEKGGTRKNNLRLWEDFQDWRIAGLVVEENSLNDQILRQNKRCLILSQRGHSEVIEPFLEKFLRISSILKQK